MSRDGAGDGRPRSQFKELGTIRVEFAFELNVFKLLVKLLLLISSFTKKFARRKAAGKTNEDRSE